MRKIREVLRLKFDAGPFARKIATRLRISSGCAGNFQQRFTECMGRSGFDRGRLGVPAATEKWSCRGAK